VTYHNPDLAFGPARCFVPVCIRHKHGFYGGPAGYQEMPKSEAKERAPITLLAPTKPK
jgi:hypothetical protein